MENNIEEPKEQVKKANELVKSLEEKIQELQDKPKNVRWRAAFNGMYYYVRTGGVDSLLELNIGVDDFLYNTGNYFQTREEAEQYKNNLIIVQKLKDIALKLNDGVEIDWTNGNQVKYSICFQHDINKIFLGLRRLKTQGVVFCLSNKFLKEAIREIGEKEIINYIKNN